jgi:hypothetical protein
MSDPWAGCICPFEIKELGRLHGVSMGKGRVRVSTSPSCPVHGTAVVEGWQGHTEQSWRDADKSQTLIPEPVPDRHQDDGGKHIFTITVTVRGATASPNMDDIAIPFTVTERAWNLADAVRQAAERPFADWCHEKVVAERNADHERALMDARRWGQRKS